MADVDGCGIESLTPSGSTRFRGRAGYWAILSSATSAPTITFSPVAPATITENQNISVTVTNTTGAVSRVTIVAEYPALGFAEVIYDNSYEPAFASYGIISTVTDGFTYTFHRNTPWLASPKIRALAVVNPLTFSTATYLLSSSSTFAAPVSPLSVIASPGSVLPCNAITYDQDYYLALLDRSFPQDYIESIKAKPNGGYEIFQSVAKLGERLSLAIARLRCCVFLTTALGGVKATGQVEFYRDVATYGAITVSTGTIVRASSGGQQFYTTEDAVFGALDLGPVVVGIEAVAVGYEYNIPGQQITAGGETLEGEIDTIELMVTPPAAIVIDPEMRVRQPSSTSGGRPACLDGIGKDLGVERITGESDESYRLRIIEAPDSVSPAAIKRICDKLLAPYGFLACLREVGTVKFPGVYCDAGASTDIPQEPKNNYAFDQVDCVQISGPVAGLFKSGEVVTSGAKTGRIAGTQTSGVFTASTIILDYPYINEFAPGDTITGALTGDTAVLSTVTEPRLADRFKLNLSYLEFRAFFLIGVPTLSVTGLYSSIYSAVNAARAGGVGFDLYIEDEGCL